MHRKVLQDCLLLDSDIMDRVLTGLHCNCTKYHRAAREEMQ